MCIDFLEIVKLDHQGIEKHIDLNNRKKEKKENTDGVGFLSAELAFFDSVELTALEYNLGLFSRKETKSY